MKEPLVINFDDSSERETIVTIEYRGVVQCVDRERLLRLFEREERYARSLAQREAPPAPVSPVSVAATAAASAPSAIVPKGGVTHASLSNRIRRIYNYGLARHELRATQVGLLVELIANFDWRIPTHAETELDRHLAEMLSWQGVTSELRAAVDAFLVRYTRKAAS